MAQRRRSSQVKLTPSKAAGIDPEQARLSLGPLGEFVGYALRRAQLSVFEAFARALAEFQLRPSDFGVLIVIDSNAGLRSIDVCNMLGFQKTNFVALIRRLEHRGLVARVAHKIDRRAQTLQLTPAGRRLLQQALKAHIAFERPFQDVLGGVADTRKFISQCNRLARVR